MKKTLFLFLLLMGVSLADQGMTSASHSANVGKIVFSTKEIVFKNEDPSQFRSSFKLGEPIYGRLYFKQSMKNTPLYHTQGGSLYSESFRNGDWEMLMSVDGVNQNIKFGNYAQGSVTGNAESEWTSWQMNLQPDDPKKGDSNITDPWIKVASRLKPGSHDVKLLFRATQGAYQSKPMAEGSFTLTVAEGASFAAGSLPPSTYSGADLEKIKENMKSALVGPVAKSFSEILDVSVTSDWQSGRFTDTLVEYRKIQGTVLWADSDGDGVSRYTSYSFIQNKQGDGWTALRFNAFVNGGPEGNVKR